MKRAVKVQGKVEVPEDKFRSLLRKINKGLSKWEPGMVHSCLKPEWVENLERQALVNLNSSGAPKYCFRNGPNCLSETLAFGFGSVQSHRDYMSGVTLLTLLGCRDYDWVPESAFDGDLKSLEAGEFYSGGKPIFMTRGESIVFDDRETHSWLFNGYWFFSLRALKRSKPSLKI